MKASKRFGGMALAGALLAAIAGVVPAWAESGTSAQHRAAEEYLGAVATGDARALAQTIHDAELTLLRKRMLDEMLLEAERNESLLRSRWFGSGMPLADIERLTPQNFFATLAQKLRFGGRQFDGVDWLAVVPDSGGMVHLVGRGKPPKDLGRVRVPVLVSLLPWGKDWKAALPLELQAQIDDLGTARVRAPQAPVAPAQAAAAAGAASAANPASPAALLEVLQAGEENLKAKRCEEYYNKQMSPNFRRTTAAKALRALVAACESRDELRERQIAALRLARSATPRFEYAGTRATFDLRGQGLPFNALVLEQVDKRWYIAE